MTEVHRYSVVKMLSEGGNRISYDPYGPEVVMASAYDQLKADNERVKAELKKVDADRKACWAEFKVQGRQLDQLKAENEALRKERDARHPFKPFHEPVIGFTGCVICGVYTDHGGLPCPKTRAAADAAMDKEGRS